MQNQQKTNTVSYQLKTEICYSGSIPSMPLGHGYLNNTSSATGGMIEMYTSFSFKIQKTVQQD